MKKIVVFIFSFIFAFALLSVVSAQCNIGEINMTSASFCNLSGQMQSLKADGVSCENDFECLGSKCLEGTCSHGVAAEIAQQKGLLQNILDLFKTPLPVGTENITANTTTTFNFSTTVYEVRIRSSKSVYATVSTSSIGTNIPASVNAAPPGKIYQYLDVSTFPASARGSINNAIINFKIEKNWFASNNCNSSTVVLSRYVGEEKRWTRLVTTKINETSTHIFYKATSPGLSIFAITSERNAISIACGDNACTGGESQSTCCLDCGCPAGKSCSGNVCISAGQNATTCDDGIKNQGETGMDCGGPCAACSPECGNGIIEEGENCLNCALDVKCSEGEACKYKQCIKQGGSILPYIIIIVLVIVGAIVIPKKLKKAKKKNEEMETKTHSMIVYMLDALKTGVQESELKDRMFKAGWKNTEIEFALKNAKQQVKEGEKSKKVESVKK